MTKGITFSQYFFYDNPHLTTTVYTLEKQQEQSKMLSVTLFVANYRAVSHPVGDKQVESKIKKKLVIAVALYGAAAALNIVMKI
jgi:hypothetical protein